MDSISPVIPGLEPYEINISGPENNQPEFKTLHVLHSPEGKILTRWQLTPEEREAVAKGADIYFTLVTMNQPVMPMSCQVITPSADIADIIKIGFNLDDDLDLRMLTENVKNAVQALEQRRGQVIQKLQAAHAPTRSEGGENGNS